MHKKFEVNRTKIKGGCQSYTKAAPQESWSDWSLDSNLNEPIKVLIALLESNHFKILEVRLLCTTDSLP